MAQPAASCATDAATAALLWDASRPEAAPELVAAHIDGGADVQRAARLAIDQSVGPLLWRALELAGRLDGLADMAPRLHMEYEARRGQAGLLQPAAAAAALDPLRAAGIEAVVMKGAMLVERYPALGLRPMDDIDLLVRPDRLEPAITTLVAAGWSLNRGHGPRQYDAILVHPQLPHLPLELHCELETWRERATGLRAAHLWAARAPVDCMGTPALGLPVVEELLLLVVHAGKPFHHFRRLIWAVDLAVVIGSADALDWDRLAARARALGASTVLAVGMHQAQRLGATVPDQILTVPEGRMRRAAVQTVLDETWPLADVTSNAMHRLRYGLPDLLRYRLQLSLGEISADGWRAAPAHAARLVGPAIRRWISPWGRT